jgi:hypothetical protein
LCWFWHCCKTILHHCWCYYNNIFLLMCQSVCWSFIILYIIFVLCSYAKMFLYVIFPIIDAWVIKSLLLCIILLFSPCFVPMLAKLWAYNDFIYANFINFIEQHFSFYVRSKVVIQCNALIVSSIFNCFLC